MHNSSDTHWEQYFLALVVAQVVALAIFAVFAYGNGWLDSDAPWSLWVILTFLVLGSNAVVLVVRCCLARSIMSGAWHEHSS